MAGSLPPSNCTSTTAPMTCVTLPRLEPDAASAAKPRAAVPASADPRDSAAGAPARRLTEPAA
jgi:hypothetical protein